MRRSDGWYARWTESRDRYGAVCGPYEREHLPVPADASLSEAKEAFAAWRRRKGLDG